MEALGENAENGVRLAIEQDGAADDTLVAAQPRLPHFMREHGHRRAVRHIFGLSEGAARLRVHAEDLEEARGNRKRLHLLRPVAGSQIHSGGCQPVQRHRLENVVVLPGHVLGNGDGIPPAAVGKLAGDFHHAVRFRVRQGLQQHRIHYREDGGVDADPQRQRQNRDGGKPRISGQHAERIANVESQCAHTAQYDHGGWIVRRIRRGEVRRQKSEDRRGMRNLGSFLTSAAQKRLTTQERSRDQRERLEPVIFLTSDS